MHKLLFFSAIPYTRFLVLADNLQRPQCGIKEKKKNFSRKIDYSFFFLHYITVDEDIIMMRMENFLLTNGKKGKLDRS